MKEEYIITGMSCAACSSSVERVTKKLPGVISCSVNLTTGRMNIEYDETKTNKDQIMEKVKKAGFGISLYVVEKEHLKVSVEQRKEEQRLEYNKKKQQLIIAVSFAIPLLYISMGHMVNLPMPSFLEMSEHPLSFALIQLGLTIPILIAGRKFYYNGIRTLMKKNPNMDTLVAIGTGAAFLYSLIMTIQIPLHEEKVHSLYYESAAVVVTLIMLGKFLESRSKEKTGHAIQKMMELAPDTAIIWDGEKEKVVDIDQVQLGDCILVKAGMKIPADGKVIGGSSSVDESMMTGESLPVEKTIDDMVIQGSQNYNGMLTIIVTRIGENTTLAKIIRLMEEAQGKKAPISKLADKVAGIFVPAVIGIAFLAVVIWLICGQSFSFVLNIFVSVLVIACPCALGLATPTAIMVGTGLGASHGILIKSGEKLEITHLVDTIVLDKTGTITKGTPKLIDILCFSETRERALAIAACVEQGSEHPIAKALIEAYQAQKDKFSYTIKDFSSKNGMGVHAWIKETQEEVWIGNEKMCLENSLTIGCEEDEVKKLAQKGQTPVYLFLNGKLCAIFGIADTIKETSAKAIDKLKGLGLKVYMLTGDHRLAAQHIGHQVHVDEVISEVLPSQKAEVIKKLQESGKKVCMVGDGINDAPSLIQADVGIAIGSGSDIAIDSADIVLMRSDLMDVYRSIRLSRKTIKNIKENLFWAFFYNCIGIPIAAGVLYPQTGILLNPMIGGLAMSLSSVCVVSNALRLRYQRLD